MRTATSILAFISVSVLTAIALGSGLHRMDAQIAFVAVFAGVIGGVGTFIRTKSFHEKNAPLSILDIGIFLIFAFAAWRSFFWLLYANGDAWFVLSRYNLGDICLHVNLIQYLTQVSPCWPQSTILANTTLTYPIGIDLFNGLLLNLHIGLIKGLVWTGILGSVLSAYALWKWGRAFTISAFLFGGGVIALVALIEPVSEPEWKNPFLSLFVTQRGWLFALPATLLLLWSWRERLRKKTPLPGRIELLFYAVMPIFNVHAFLFLSMALTFIWIFNPAHRRRFFCFTAAAFLPATLCMALVTNCFQQTGGIHWKIGWMQTDPALIFWILNFGISLPLVLVLCCRLYQNQDRIALSFVGASSFVFLLCMLISFAPWEWDNTKLMLLSWLTVTPFLWEYVIKPTKLPVRGAICFLLFASGAMTLWQGLDHSNGFQLIKRAEVDLTRTAIAKVPLNERFACAPEYNHPLLFLGRPVIAGYEGHLWSHGLDYKPTLIKLTTLMEGGDGWESALHSLHARYMFWGPREAAKYPASSKPWETCAVKIAETEWGTVWDLQKCLDNSGHQTKPK
ncbi:MAG: hypothetical protein ABIP97_00795 [Chthoniobacterales bacterium]